VDLSWLNWLGVETARIPRGAEAEFVFTHAPRSWMVFVWLAVVGLLVWAVVWLYRREPAEVSPRVKGALAAVRVLVIALIVLVLLGPALAYSTQRTIAPQVIVLVDDSLSMSLTDRYVDPAEAARAAAVLGMDPARLAEEPVARAALVQAVLDREDGQWLRDLARRGRVRVMSFGREVRLRATVPARTEAQARSDSEDGADRPVPIALDPIEPTGRATNIAHALREALGGGGNAPVAGVVLISDGQYTEGDDPLNVADLARELGTPVFTIGVGAVDPPRNLRVVEMWAPDSVFREDPFVVEAELQAEGYADEVAEVELLARRVRDDGSAGPDEGVERQTVTFDAARSTRRIRFEHQPTEAGRFVYTVRLRPAPGESLESDNARSLPVKVLSDQARVLLIAGAPSWEYRMVSTLLIRDKTTDVSCFLQTMDPQMRQSGNTVIERLPASPEELFEYDAVIFMDPNPEAFNPAWIDALRRFLGEHAGGVMWVAGPKFFADFLRRDRTADVRSLLPVVIGDLNALVTELLTTTHSKQWPLMLTPAGADHALLRLHDDPQVNRRMWQAMPGIFWSFPAREPKPAAQVLLEHSDPRLKTRDGPRPLLVAGQFGPGRTVYMGFSGSWRWRQVGERYFDQFWVRAVRYLMEGRLLGERNRGRLATERDVYPVGEQVTVTAELYNAAFRPLDAEQVEATLQPPGQPAETLVLTPVANEPGRYRGSFVARQMGLNEIALTLDDGPADAAEPVRLARQVTVEIPQVEFADTRLNRSLLQQLAERTGGTYLAIDQTHVLDDLIPPRSETLIIRGKPIELWDNWPLMVVLIALLTVEWALRKRMRMM